jgi:hypothetical protein
MHVAQRYPKNVQARISNPSAFPSVLVLYFAAGAGMALKPGAFCITAPVPRSLMVGSALARVR